MSLKWTLGALLLAAIALFWGDAGEPAAPDEHRLRVVVSIVPQAWLLEQLGGPHVMVRTLVSSSDSPHSYRPSDAQIVEVMRASVYFRIGVPFERGPWFQSLRERSGLKLVDVRRGISLRGMQGHSHAQDAHSHETHHPHTDSEPRASARADSPPETTFKSSGEDPGVSSAVLNDPHIWTSPRLLKIQARTMASTLMELDQDNEQEYRRRLNALLQRLDDLDAAIRTKLAPFRGRAFFIFHPAWGYFAEEYGLRQIAIQVEGKEPTDSELTELQRRARSEEANVIFVQPQIFGRSVRAVAEVVGTKLTILDPMAKDVAANLMHFTDMLVESYQR